MGLSSDSTGWGVPGHVGREKDPAAERRPSWALAGSLLVRDPLSYRHRSAQ